MLTEKFDPVIIGTNWGAEGTHSWVMRRDLLKIGLYLREIPKTGFPFKRPQALISKPLQLPCWPLVSCILPIVLNTR